MPGSRTSPRARISPGTSCRLAVDAASCPTLPWPDRAYRRVPDRGGAGARAHTSRAAGRGGGLHRSGLGARADRRRTAPRRESSGLACALRRVRLDGRRSDACQRRPASAHPRAPRGADPRRHRSRRARRSRPHPPLPRAAAVAFQFPLAARRVAPDLRDRRPRGAGRPDRPAVRASAGDPPQRPGGADRRALVALPAHANRLCHRNRKGQPK